MSNVVSIAAKKPRPRTRTKGLLGLAGHTYVPDPEGSDQPIIEWQFEIVRELPGKRYVIQLYSWMDCGPTEVKVMSEDVLLGPTVKLYATHEDRNEKECDRRRWDRQS